MKKLPFNDQFYCEHLVLTRETNIEIDNFVVCKHPEGKGLMDYLQQKAVRDENDGVMRTYFVRDQKTGELVAYFSLRASSIKLEVMYGNSQGMYPCIELAYFAMNDAYIDKHPYSKGSGLIIFHEIILPLVKEISKTVGTKGIIGYAINSPKLLEHYIKDYGFARLPHENEEELHQVYRPVNDQECVFIYMDIN
ncbi:MAG: hypothetical protein K5669_09485 [Lachnospiraceae bacterium]|nr:hypothetical protein [Lachnospiraceae bacterium]